MKNEELNFTSEDYLLHRILKTDIKKDPEIQEDEIIFGCCFWEQKNVFETSWSCQLQ